MARRVLIGVGLTVTLVAAAGLGVYFVAVGLDKADKLASVLGLFVAVVGLVLAVYGMVSDRARAGDQPERRQVPAAREGRSVSIGGDNSGIVSTGDDATNIQTG